MTKVISSRRGTAPGPTGPAIFEATNRFEELAHELMEAAPREVLLRALGQALARTSRQLHTLEQLVIPALRAHVAGLANLVAYRDRMRARYFADLDAAA